MRQLIGGIAGIGIVFMLNACTDQPAASDARSARPLSATAIQLESPEGTCEYGVWPNCEWNPRGGGLPVAPGAGGGGDQGDTIRTDTTTKQPCHTGYAVLDDTAVQTAMDSMWRASKYPSSMSDRREHGGWIIRTPDGKLRFEAFPASWSSQPCSIQNPPDIWPPLGTIAMFHTHPYREHELLTRCARQDLPGGGSWYVNYSHQASTEDDELMRRFRNSGAPNLIGIIADAEKIIAYDGQSELLVDRCGY